MLAAISETAAWLYSFCFSLFREVHFTTRKNQSVGEGMGAAVIHQRQMASLTLGLPGRYEAECSIGGLSGRSKGSGSSPSSSFSDNT